jgi:hypothetical protein
MQSMRFSKGNDLNVKRVLKLLRERKCLNKVPNKTIEYYNETSRAHPKKAVLTPFK